MWSNKEKSNIAIAIFENLKIWIQSATLICNEWLVNKSNSLNNKWNVRKILKTCKNPFNLQICRYFKNVDYILIYSKRSNHEKEVLNYKCNLKCIKGISNQNTTSFAQYTQAYIGQRKPVFIICNL